MAAAIVEFEGVQGNAEETAEVIAEEIAEDMAEEMLRIWP